MSGISWYSLYGSHEGTRSERLLYPEIRTKHVCCNETPLYVRMQGMSPQAAMEVGVHITPVYGGGPTGGCGV